MSWNSQALRVVGAVAVPPKCYPWCTESRELYIYAVSS
jgi:hypothetical protein